MVGEAPLLAAACRKGLWSCGEEPGDGYCGSNLDTAKNFNTVIQHRLVSLGQTGCAVYTMVGKSKNLGH